MKPTLTIKNLVGRYDLTVGNSAKGIDLPDAHISTDIKVTSAAQPQSSCPFESARQKIFGLGYNLLIFVYDKHDFADKCTLNINFLRDRNLPGDEITFTRLAEEILSNAPPQGYLTVSNALQWRLQYSRAISLNNSVEGVVNYDWQA